MRNYYSTFTWVIFILFIFGIGKVFILRPLAILIPLIVIGTVYYFLKHPEKLSSRNRDQKRNYYSTKARTTKKRKSYPFKVIDGNKNLNKNDNDENENKPKYH